MTQKDYIALAAAVKRARQSVPTNLVTSEWEDFHSGIDLVLNQIIDVLAANNERFDENKFRKAAAL